MLKKATPHVTRVRALDQLHRGDEIEARLSVGPSYDDVVIRPMPNRSGGRTTWMLSRPTGTTLAAKMRLEPTRRAPQQKVHPGHDWFFVVEGRVRLSLGDRQILVETGEAAEFATMTPHAFEAVDGPAERDPADPVLGAQRRLGRQERVLGEPGDPSAEVLADRQVLRPRYRTGHPVKGTA